MRIKKRFTRFILNACIRKADDYALSLMIPALVERYSQIFPDWEFMTFFIPKNDPEQRKLSAEYLIRLSEEIIRAAEQQENRFPVGEGL